MNWSGRSRSSRYSSGSLCGAILYRRFLLWSSRTMDIQRLQREKHSKSSGCKDLVISSMSSAGRPFSVLDAPRAGANACIGIGIGLGFAHQMYSTSAIKSSPCRVDMVRSEDKKRYPRRSGSAAFQLPREKRRTVVGTGCGSTSAPK